MTLSLKARFYARATPLATTTGVVQAHRRKNQKNNSFSTICSAHENGFYCFSSDDVFSCRATSDDGRAFAGACSQAKSHAVSTKTRSAKTSAEGFFRFLLTSETCIKENIFGLRRQGRKGVFFEHELYINVKSQNLHDSHARKATLCTFRGQRRVEVQFFFLTN